MLTIKVTQKDIDDAHKEEGIKMRTRSCPIARAARRVMKKRDIQAGHSFIGNREYRYTTPNEAARFMSLFDKGLPVSPIEFTLTERYR